jgi:rubrerythrin
MWLSCSARCGGQLFRALFAEVDVDAGGDFQDYRVAQPAYICLNCGAPAFDLGEVPVAMADEAAEEEAEALPTPVNVLCPVCETLVTVVPGDECPNCGAFLEVA